MDVEKLLMAVEVAIESAKKGSVTEEQAMRFLISQYNELKGEESTK